MRRLLTVLAILSLCASPALAKKKKKRKKRAKAAVAQSTKVDLSWRNTLHQFRPLRSDNHLVNAYLLANLSELVYASSDSTIRTWASAMGCDKAEVVRKKGKAMLLCARQGLVIVAIQGSGSNGRDLRRVLNGGYHDPNYPGRVHNGGHNLSKQFRGPVEGFLKKHPGKKLFMTGHSMGGLAVMALGAYLQHKRRIMPQAVFTFGMPRLGNRKFRKALRFEHYHYVNEGDGAAVLYPAKLDPNGDLQFFDNKGKLQRNASAGKVGRMKWLRGWATGVDKVIKSGSSAHDMQAYVKHIRRILNPSDRGRLPEPKDF